MREIQLFILLLLITNFAVANVTCDSHYSISIEKKIQNVINSQKTSLNTKAEKVHDLVAQTLKNRKILYRTADIDGFEAIIIKPSKTSKLGRFARYLDNNYQVKLAISFGLTGKIDAGLDMSDQGILLTSVQDILRGDIGPGTRHELSHLWELTASELNTPHPVFNANIRSESPMFKNGYEHYITYGEVHAYSRELHYSLWKLRHAKNPEMKAAYELDVKEAYNRLKEITSQLKVKTESIHKNLRKYKVSKDDYTFFIKGSDWNMSIDQHLPKLKDQLKLIIDHLAQLEQKLESTHMSDLETILVEYLSSLK